MIKRIKDTSKTLPRVVDTSATQPKVDSQVVAKALGAEPIGYIGANPNNLPLPKPVQERLAKNLGTDNNESQSELVAIEVS